MTSSRLYFLLIGLIASLLSYGQNTIPQHFSTREKIGWIPFDAKVDDPNFKVCDELNIEEYYQVNPLYGEGMASIRNYFFSHKQQLETLCQKDGYIIVRFVINCQGQTDRFRSSFMSMTYSDESTVNTELQRKVVQLVRAMGIWTPGTNNGKTYDCYQHLKLIFKNSQLVDILF